MSTARVNLHERYDLSREIGSGAMGTVYLARDRVIDRQVVLKTLRDPAVNGEESAQRLIEEARSAGRINHPNVVTVYDVISDEKTGRFYLALEYVEGRTLSQILAQEKRLSVDHAAALVLQVAAGLQHLHDAGLIHRDIKPSNILVDVKGVAKITDFGIARAAGASQLELDGTVFGTPPYMAPEQLLGLDLDARADVYALGSVFYEMVSGRKPIEAESVTGVARGTLRAEVTPLREVAPDVPAAVRGVIERAMNRESAARFESMDELAAGVRAATGMSGPVDLLTLVGARLSSGVHQATVPLPGRRLQRLGRALHGYESEPWAVRLRIGSLVLLLVLAIGLASGWWLFERTAGAEADAATDLAQETRALEAVLAREGQKLLQAGDPEGAITVAALLEGLAPRSAAAKQLRGGAEELTQRAGVVPDAPRIVRRPVQDPARVAREVLGDSPRAAEVSAALTRLAEARDRLQLASPSATSLEIGLRSEVPRGSVVVYAGDRQIYKREFSFVERRGFFRRQGVAGELSASVGLEPGEYELLVYVVRRNEPARLTRLATVVGAGDSLQLEIVVPTSGAPEVRLL
ncbi:MAG TPA: protein kinase [Thermoanaerobaculia bacterium]|nr:protein kinase [Thermoanaerobaculia bacterium]